MKRFEDLIKNNGSSSLYEVSQEIGLKLPRSQFIPGRFYSLKIISPTPDLNEQCVTQLSGGRSYYDLAPVGLSIFHDNWKEVALILNLKAIPPAASARILEAYYAFASQNGMTSLYREGELLPLAERSLLDQRFYMVPPSILSQIVGATNLNYAINKYNIDQIAEARLIDWCDFGRLINPRIDNRGIFPENLNLATLYEEFITNSLT